MALAFGEKIVSKVYFGGKVVSAIYLGTKKVFPEEEEYLPGTGDIRLRIETTREKQLFILFYQITTEEGGFVTVDWGDGNKETFTGKTTYTPKHVYTEIGEYIIKLTGSKFTEVGQDSNFPPIAFRDAIREILSLKMPTDSTGVSLDWAFCECDKLVGSIPEWGANITEAHATYGGCSGLTGSIPEWGANITSANYTYRGCTGLTGSIPEWEANITSANYTYYGCTGLTGSIPAWGANITSANYTYYGCTGLTRCSTELLQDPMPSRITSHAGCVYGCKNAIRQHFIPDWGGTKTESPEYLPGTGDIRLRIQTTSANQSFRLFKRIATEKGGYVSVDWGDGNKETFINDTSYPLKHTYAKKGEYVVKLTGSKFTRVEGELDYVYYHDFTTAVREILSLKMPTDSTSVSLWQTFYDCDKLTGSIPEWDNCITNTYGTYEGCSGLTGSIPEWGANITEAHATYGGCSGLTGSIPEWSANITSAYATYDGCSGLTGSIPEWGANIWYARYTYRGCTGLTGNIPEWSANITEAEGTYLNCTGLTGCSKELLQDPMPSRITSHDNCVYGCVDAIRQHFTEDWGGTKLG